MKLVRDQVWVEVSTQVEGKAASRIKSKVWGQVESQVWGQVGDLSNRNTMRSKLLLTALAAASLFSPDIVVNWQFITGFTVYLCHTGHDAC